MRYGWPSHLHDLTSPKARRGKCCLSIIQVNRRVLEEFSDSASRMHAAAVVAPDDILFSPSMFWREPDLRAASFCSLRAHLRPSQSCKTGRSLRGAGRNLSLNRRARFALTTSASSQNASQRARLVNFTEGRYALEIPLRRIPVQARPSG